MRFAGSAQTDAALLALQVRPASHQSRGQVLQLSQFHLQLSFVAAGALREDIQDKSDAIKHAAAARPFHIPLLGGTQRMIENNEFGGAGFD